MPGRYTRLVAKGYDQEYGVDYEEVFSPVAKLTSGYKGAKEGQVCKLVKSLYGLKQASREWNAEFYLKAQLHEAFTIKDLGEAKFFLGMEIIQSSSGTSLNQRKYILDLLQTVGLLGCKSVTTPLPPGILLSSESGNPLAAPEQYIKLVGQLLYLNLTRPDLSHAVQQLSQFMAAPSTSHWDAAIHVLKYLKGCPSLGLHFPTGGSLKLIAYSDADYGNCLDSRKSLTGYCVLLGGALVSWRCKKQNTVSSSSSEAEYRALSMTTKELLWLSYLFKDFLLPFAQPVPLYCDNQAAIHITKNPVFHERTKHLEIDCHLVRHHYMRGFLSPLQVSTASQLADFFTKSLSGPRFRFLLSKMQMLDIHASSS